MGQSLVKNFLHITFSTRHRQPLIHENVENDLYAYIGTVCKSLDCFPVKIGGYTDHIHILCNLSKKLPLMDLLEKVKANSSGWMKKQDKALFDFYWQNGYGAFSVNPSELDKVVGYIENQKEHHRQRTFQDEFRAFLKKYNVKYDERYVWD